MTTSAALAELLPEVLPTLAEAVHAGTLASPAPISNNADILDDVAPETAEQVAAKVGVIAKCQSMWLALKAYTLGKGPIQAKLIGYVAELLLLNPTNRELAAAMSEPYDANYHGPAVLKATKHTEEYIGFREGNKEVDLDFPVNKKGEFTNPNPYRQSVRKYKILAMIEAKLPGEDQEGNPWDLTKLADGIRINSVLYTSPIHALESGVVSMEAVFQAYTNVLQPAFVDMNTWSTSVVNEAKGYASKVKVVVRAFNKKANREAKQSVTAVNSAACLYGLIMGLLEFENDKKPIFFGQDRADKMIEAVKARISGAE